MNTLRKTLNTCNDAVESRTFKECQERCHSPTSPFKMAGPMSSRAEPALLRFPEGAANL